MAEVEDIVRGPSYNVNLAEVGKPEELPDIGAAMTQAFQRATNLVETSWFNQYQYQKAQYDLQDSAAKLQGLNIENKLQQQNYQQRADSFPLDQQRRQLDLNQSQINLDQQKYAIGQRDQATTDLAAFQSELNALDANDPDYVNKLSTIVSKHTLAGSNPATLNQFNTLLNAKNTTYQNSSQQQVRNFYLKNLTALQEPGPNNLLDPHIDVAAEIAKGNGPALWQQAQQQEANKRLTQLQLAATDPTDKVIIGRLKNEINAPPGQAGGYFGPDGTLDATINGQIAGLETKYGVANPFAGAKTQVVTKKYDKQGNVIEERTDTGLPYTPPAPEVQIAPKDYKYDTSLDPIAQQARTEIAKENPNADPNSGTFAHRVLDRYHELRTKAGLPADPTQDEINKNFQQSQIAKQSKTPQVYTPPVQPNVQVPQQPNQQQQNQKVIRTPETTRRKTSFVFPEEQAPEGSWQRAWNETVGQLASTGPSNEEIQQAIEESESRARFASTETGVPEWYRFENPSPSNPQGGGGGSYTPPKGATAVAGINPGVWGMVMREEGPEFGPDGNHPSVFGLWGDKAGVEGQAYQVVRQYGAHSPEAYNAVTSAWVNGFLRQSQPWLLNSPGMQGLVISDSQHQGGAAAARIIEEMGGWQAINQMDPKQAVAEYTRLRQGLWPGNQSRVRREEGWALANS